jgi:hypothetical protein
VKIAEEIVGDVVALPGSRVAAIDNKQLAGGGSGPRDPGMEARVAKFEADVGHIRSDVTEVKGLLNRLAPCIDEMYGKLSHVGTKEDLVRLTAEMEGGQLGVRL